MQQGAGSSANALCSSRPRVVVRPWTVAVHREIQEHHAGSSTACSMCCHFPIHGMRVEPCRRLQLTYTMSKSWSRRSVDVGSFSRHRSLGQWHSDTSPLARIHAGVCSKVFLLSIRDVLKVNVSKDLRAGGTGKHRQLGAVRECAGTCRGMDG